MEENKRRLIDEAIFYEPVKNTFRLAWEFIILNRQFTLIAMGMFFILSILSAFLGLIAMIFSGILSMAIQIYISKLIYETENINTFIDEIQKSKLENIFSKHIFVAMGAYLGTIFLFLMLSFLISFVIKSMGIDLVSVLAYFFDFNTDTLGVELQQVTPSEVTQFLQVFVFPLFIGFLWMSYIHPLVESNIARSSNFKEGYRAIFTFFSLNLWKKALQANYFKYIFSLLFIVVLGLLFFGVILTIPGINILASFVIVIVMYFYMVIMAIASMMARRMVEE